jgi:hypothetical protein
MTDVLKEDDERLGNPLCLHCAEELIGHVQFCPKCGCPATPEAASMPYESVLARGFAFREGSTRPRKLVVVIGVWLLVGPTFLVFSGFLVAVLLNVRDFFDRPPQGIEGFIGLFLGLALIVALAAISGALLFKTTVNYVKQRREMRDEPDDDGEWDEDSVRDASHGDGA